MSKRRKEERGRFTVRRGALAVTADCGEARVEALAISEETSVEVTATQGERSVSRLVPVRVVSELQRRVDAGIPQARGSR